MSSSTPAVRVDDSRDGLRPLPPKPSLELERKHAKALLRQLRRGEPSALSRLQAWHPAALRTTSPAELKLADAQHVIAREYGFASWPRLVRYFRDIEMQAHVAGAPQGYGRDFYDGRVDLLVREHREQCVWAARALASFVPRFYGASVAEVLSSSITIEDARVVVARQNRCTSCGELLDRAEAERLRNDGGTHPWDRKDSPFMRAVRAMDAQDLASIKAIVGEHPELLHPVEGDERRGRTLVGNALLFERQQRTPEARQITEWLVSQRADLVHPLNRALLGNFMIKTIEVQYLLDRGADPNWMPPNGVSVLEHALVRYWNGEAVDLIARRVTARRALWIAAGLGDVDGVRQYLDKNRKPTPAAYRDRPPLGLMSPNIMPALPEPDEFELLLEVMLIATLNGRSAVIELLIKAGIPVDYMGWGGMNMLHLAVGNQRLALVETLVKLGADLDLKGRHPYASARELACQRLEHEAASPTARRIVELCGCNPEQVLAAAEERRPKPPPLDQRVIEALELAGDDATRLGQPDIRPENVLVGILRARFPLPYLQSGGVDLERLRLAIPDRVRFNEDKVERPKLPLDSDVQEAIQRAISLADGRRRNSVTSNHLLHALVENESGAVAGLLVSAGGTLSKIRAQLEMF